MKRTGETRRVRIIKKVNEHYSLPLTPYCTIVRLGISRLPVPERKTNTTALFMILQFGGSQCNTFLAHDKPERCNKLSAIRSV